MQKQPAYLEVQELRELVGWAQRFHQHGMVLNSLALVEPIVHTKFDGIDSAAWCVYRLEEDCHSTAVLDGRIPVWEESLRIFTPVVCAE